MSHMLDPVPPCNWLQDRVCIIVDEKITVSLSGPGRVSYLVEMWQTARRRTVGLDAFEQVVAPECSGDWFQQQRTEEPLLSSVFHGGDIDDTSVASAFYSSFMYCSPFEAYVTYVFALLKPEVGPSASSPRQD